MRVVVVGDLAYRGRYHLGDEAMSEVALHELTARGAEVAFIAGDPEVCSEFYGVPSVARFGFASKPTREAKERHLEEIVAAVAAPGSAASGPAPAGTEATLDALRRADAVLIAGGGNLNSIGVHHVYERVAVKRVAERLGLPLVVTSQTVGPHLRERERALTTEIAEYAAVFGVRERSSAALLRSICGEAARIVHTLDDAILLEPAPVRRGDLGLPERYAVGSFTFHAHTTGLDEDDYYREIAGILDGLVARLDIDVVLLPHMSTFEVPNPLGPADDQFGHDRIARFSRSGRVRALPLLPARELLTVTRSAAFSVSTRYHPLVFGAALGVPAVGIVTSYYSAVRMRGALENVGMEGFAIPFEYWRPVLGAPLAEALAARLDEFAEHSARVGGEQREYQRRWWDGLYACLSGTGEPLLADRRLPEPVEWAEGPLRDTLTQSRVAQETVGLDRLNAMLDAEAARLRERDLERRLAALERSRDEQQRELAELRHRTRPPGAALRDRVRLKLRELRGR